MPLKIEAVLFTPPYGSPASRRSPFPQPSLIFDTGGKPRGPAMAVASMLAAAVWLTMPRGCSWLVHVDERFEGGIIGAAPRTTRRRVWVELGPGDSPQHALDILKIVAERQGVARS